MKKIIKKIYEDASVIVNNVGSGNIAGTGIGPKGEPGFKKKKTKFFRRKSIQENNDTFMGNKCFEVEPEFFHKCILGKKRYDQYINYVGDDDVGQSIRKYGLENPGYPIIVKNKFNGAMCFLRYGKYNINEY